MAGPAYPQQPEDAERPVPMRAAPERAQDPEEWDSGSLEPAGQRHVDRVVAQRRADEADARTHGDAAHDEAVDADVQDESGYSTETEQGAMAPRSTSQEETS
ncbi:MAG TPA: hypothetical protein VFL59_05190 [Candidatus Nanopelagicales bacterium]|nr:hypothetical protein [Candidatus Nanopelagicales bacterium]